jgi:hypothetical protein
MAVWKIEGWDSTRRIFELRAPGNLEPREVTRMLQRLACRDLSPQEIVSSSLRRNHKERANFLDPICRNGGTIHVGNNPYYVATKRAE